MLDSNPKGASYLGDVVDQEDPRNSGTIYYYINANEIYDDYRFRTQLKMEDEVQQILELFIALPFRSQYGAVLTLSTNRCSNKYV